MQNHLKTELVCCHCGEVCKSAKYTLNEKNFCCTGCRSVYLLLHQHQLEDYYCLNERPGTRMDDAMPDRFRYLDDEHNAAHLITFSNKIQTSAVFYIPQIHCSSCLWLLEHLQRIEPEVIASRVNFSTKEITVSFSPQLSVRQVAELLTRIGYEPLIQLQDRSATKRSRYSSKAAAYKLGITGFCFANIMLISFPEYLGMSQSRDADLVTFFRYVNLLLSLPVLLYGARDFFANAWYSLRQRYLNVDAPIALAISVTFLRSVWEIATATGAGYLDSMSGIIFFMLLGRTIQNRSYSTLSFSRDYKAYLPVHVEQVTAEGDQSIPLRDIKEHCQLRIRHKEIVPTDCLLSKGKALIDYSFITGESIPEEVRPGALIYAGGRVVGNSIEVLAVKDFEHNTFIRLWNNEAFKRPDKGEGKSRIDLIARYFSVVVLLVAFSAFIYWQFVHPVNAWKAITAVLIVACPCALLLNATFINGYLLDYYARQGLFLKASEVIERLARIGHLVFDKTGTLTQSGGAAVKVLLNRLSREELTDTLSLLSQSVHPLSMAIVSHYRRLPVVPGGTFTEHKGRGLEGWINDRHIKAGSAAFLGIASQDSELSEVWVSIDGRLLAHFGFSSQLKPGIAGMIKQLGAYQVSLLSGDQELTRAAMQRVFPENATLLFRQSPEQKMEYIAALQRQGQRVMMIGDGINDAGALQQSDVGLAITDHSFSFSPACDAILDGNSLARLPEFIRLAQQAQRLVIVGFGYSIIFNVAGIWLAVSARMSPMIAAILMPLSSLGIMLIAFSGIRLFTRKRSLIAAEDHDKNMTKII